MSKGTYEEVRARVQLADGSELTTDWYERGSALAIGALLQLVKGQSAPYKVSWESREVPAPEPPSDK